MTTKIVVCSNEYKNKQLLDYSLNPSFSSIRYMSKDEFFNHYYYEYDERSYVYLMKKYHFHLDVCKVYLNNMVFIDLEKKYKSKKLLFLQSLKKELIDNHLFTYHSYFKDSIQEIEVHSIYDLDYYQEKVLDYSFQIPDFSFSPTVYEFSSMEDEVNAVCQKICSLIKEGVSLSHIFLVNVREDYYYTLWKMFSYYHIPISIPFQNSIYSTKIVQDYLNDGTLTLDNDMITTKLVSVINKLSILEEDEYKKAIFIDQLKHTMIPSKKYDNAVEIKDLKSSTFQEDDYVFLLGFNLDYAPQMKKDIEYISDKEKEEVDLYTTTYMNQRERKLIPYLISQIKNIFISYPLSSPFQKYYPSILIGDYSLNVIKNYSFTNQYSNSYNQIRYEEMLDQFYIYGEKHSDLELFHSNYPNLYDTYSNKFNGIDKDFYLEQLPVPLTLSYSSLNSYNECKFKYYIKNVLKIDPYEDTFSAFIGSLYHKILSLYQNNNFNLEEEWNRYLERRELTIKDMTLLVRIKKDLVELLDELKKQELICGYNDGLFEKEVRIKIKNDISVEFVGYIDKILYYKKIDDTYFSIIDYKSGFIDTHIEPMKYGLHMQLPIYLYLIHYSKLFDNPIFTGIYYQNILFSYPTWTPTLEEDNKKKYYLQGYSTDKIELLSRFDSTYEDSELIKSMKYNEEKGFGSYTKIMDDNLLYQMLTFTKKHIEDRVDDILNGDFTINPKIVGKDNVSCEFCHFKDLCYMTNEDIIRLPKVEDLSFLGGEE